MHKIKDFCSRLLEMFKEPEPEPTPIIKLPESNYLELLKNLEEIEKQLKERGTDYEKPGPYLRFYESLVSAIDSMQDGREEADYSLSPTVLYLLNHSIPEHEGGTPKYGTSAAANYLKNPTTKRSYIKRSDLNRLEKTAGLVYKQYQDKQAAMREKKRKQGKV